MAALFATVTALFLVVGPSLKSASAATAQAPTITSSSAAEAVIGSPFSFTVTTTGSPKPSITEIGALPPTFSIADNGNGTATITGDPAPDADLGQYEDVTITATNASGSVTQSFAIVVDPVLAFRGPTSFTAAAGVQFDTSVVVAGAGLPIPTWTESGTVPIGVSVAPEGDLLDISGTTTEDGVYPISVTAHDGLSPNVTETFTLTVDEASQATITSSPTATATVGQAFSFTVTTTGAPTPRLDASNPEGDSGGSFELPPFSATGLTFIDNEDGTATLSGTPTTPGTYQALIATDQAGDEAVTQNFTLTVLPDPIPSITSVALQVAIVGQAFSFTVTSTGTPTPSITEAGTLPPTFAVSDNGDGTATITGNPPLDANVGQYSPITLTATNANGSDSQSFTLAVEPVLSISGPSSETVTDGVPFDVEFFAPNPPGPVWTVSGDLPRGVTFIGSGFNYVDLQGTPTQVGTFPITVTADNGIEPDATASFTLTVVKDPGVLAITSDDSTTFTTGKAGTFKITTTGMPAPSMSETGTLPDGVLFTDNGNGKATLSGTPADGAAGSYPLTLTADNGTEPVTQTFTLVVDAAPTFTSADTTTFTVGADGTFTVSANGMPTPSLSTDVLPSGVSFFDNGNGTGVLSGTPAEGTAKAKGYSIKITAANSAGSSTETFTLVVNEVPAFTSDANATFTTGKVGTFKVTTSGTPNAALSETGTLPDGVLFTDNGNGKATLSGTPADGAAGSYPLTLTADNGTEPVTQTFTLVVDAAPTFTSADTTTFTVGADETFNVTTQGIPVASLSETGSLPSGVNFSDNGNGTGVLSGTPAAGTARAKGYTIKITATNSAGKGTQTFTLVVQ
jgi:large repetitive protein